MKRADSQIQSFYNFFENEIRVQLIAEQLFLISNDADATTTAAYLSAQGYDECGVESGGSVTQLVRRSDLSRGTVGDHVIGVPLERLVSPSTPIWSCLSRLASHRSLFVLGNHGVDGIVTLADLDKQPGRLLIFGLVSMLEMVLLALVRQYHPEDDWRAHITKRRLESAEELFDKRRKIGEEIDLVDCLQICDKSTICIENESFRTALGLGKDKAKKVFERLEEIRNSLAHSQLVDRKRPWQEIVKTLQTGHEILDRATKLLRTEAETLDGSLGTEPTPEKPIGSDA